MAGGLETGWEEPSAASTSGEGVIFVLESAQLEVAKVRGRTSFASSAEGILVHSTHHSFRCGPLSADHWSTMSNSFLAFQHAQVGKNYELLNCDDHANFLRRHGKDPALYRPDICHQAGARCC